MHGSVGCISLTDKAEVFVYQIFLLTYMVAFNATNQLWFHHMLIMYVVESQKFFPFSSKLKVFLPRNQQHGTYIYICSLLKKKHRQIIQKMNSNL